ncbi:DUF6427 family protein [uncultured Polaribacter sp.]|uniref:DUF6427 family protein n=1 Tax=uncultured Polaribacter sp. TaxID=174711 RepID=UPI00259B3546|nr:DUF6427 family protein [uncultured Polaribacter sp.]
MLTNFLEKSKPINFIIYLSLFFCFFLFALISSFFADNFTWTKVLESTLFFVLFLSIFFFYNFVVTKNKLTYDHSYAFLLFVLTLILFLEKLLDFNVLILLLVHLLFLRKVYSLRSSKTVIQKLFDSGFWLGILFILEPFSLLFSILIAASILLHQKITFHNLLTPLTGFITPLIIYFTYLFWIDGLEEFKHLFYLKVNNNMFIFDEDYTNWVFGVILLLTFCSVLLKSPRALSVNNSFKKSWLLLIINFIIGIFFVFLIKERKGAEVIFLAIPTTIIMANGFEVIQKKIIKDILFGGFILATVFAFFRL